MRRLVSLLLATALLAGAPAALAQSAGDEQYSDPFGQQGQPNGSQGEAPTGSAPTEAAPADAAPGTTAAQPVASQDAGPMLPATGFPAGALAAVGALMLAAGTTLRRRVS
jgi:LPXTG-motif cell wall-anchored protein